MTDVDALVAELRALEAAADAAPWYLVGKPWMADDQCDTYAISGSRDPHGGTPVLSWIEPDLLDPESEPDENERRARTNLAIAVAARNALPTLLSALEQAQRERDEAYSRGKTDGANEERTLNWSHENSRIAMLEAARGADFGLTFAEFRRINVQRCEGPTFNHNVADWSPAEWACALAGEVGEACNLIKKMRRGDDVDIGDIGRELGDVQAYLDLLAARLGLDLQEWVVRKFNEVSERRGAAERIHIGGPHVHRPDGELRPDGSDRCADCGEKFTRAALRAGKEGN